VLFIEDTGEPLYRIDRMLTHLHAAGKFAKLSGLILGTFTDNDNKEVDWIEKIWQRVVELAGGKYSVWANFPSGHGTRNITLPVGLTVAMDSGTARLSFSD
ncbi:MAG: LD-carboxypeptidase, partial [Proteobacteria bacterium]|nr:LD-carboxypeptidase [Pseudomonadota bacterium]MBU1737786.1 LD-carboxypeptidase [Pseudomonadota bacterium]